MKGILKKFKFKNNKIKSYENWFLLLRENQLTLGSLVLIEKSFQTSLSKVNKKSFEELYLIIKDIEKILKDLFNYKKINYLALMMTDKEVHFHIIPRYPNDQIFVKDLVVEVCSLHVPPPPNSFSLISFTTTNSFNSTGH